jgi:hypothetical protein
MEKLDKIWRKMVYEARMTERRRLHQRWVWRKAWGWMLTFRTDAGLNRGCVVCFQLVECTPDLKATTLFFRNSSQQMLVSDQTSALVRTMPEVISYRVELVKRTKLCTAQLLHSQPTCYIPYATSLLVHTSYATLLLVPTPSMQSIAFPSSGQPEHHRGCSARGRQG